MGLTALIALLPLPFGMVEFEFPRCLNLRTGWSNLLGEPGARGFLSLFPADRNVTLCVDRVSRTLFALEHLLSSHVAFSVSFYQRTLLFSMTMW